MLIPNGYVRIISISGGGFADGRPVRGTRTVGPFIDANINEKRRLHGPVGEQTQGTTSSYIVLINPADAPSLSERERLLLFDSRQSPLGEYAVMSARRLDFVDLIRIEV